MTPAPDAGEIKRSSRDLEAVRAALIPAVAAHLPDGTDHAVGELRSTSATGMSSERVLLDVTWNQGGETRTERLVARVAPDPADGPVRVVAGQTLPNLTAYHVAFLVAAGVALVAAVCALTVSDADAAGTMVPPRRPVASGTGQGAPTHPGRRLGQFYTGRESAGGCCWAQPDTRSSWAAREMSSSSLLAGPINWAPTGKPPAVNPAGTLIAGQPSTFHGQA